MEKMMALRSVYRAACFRSSRFTPIAVTAAVNHNRHLVSRSFFSISSPIAPNLPRNTPSGTFFYSFGFFFDYPFVVELGTATTAGSQHNQSVNAVRLSADLGDKTQG
ncbi:hypothetical protein Gotur_017840 [Gossypium turneri]